MMHSSTHTRPAQQGIRRRWLRGGVKGVLFLTMLHVLQALVAALLAV